MLIQCPGAYNDADSTSEERSEHMIPPSVKGSVATSREGNVLYGTHRNALAQRRT